MNFFSLEGNEKEEIHFWLFSLCAEEDPRNQQWIIRVKERPWND
jgi:hypothetical protein